MKNFKKQYFNMVEIVLALAVVSVAIVSLMGMLPVALRASKNSVADNSVAATVEVMKSFIDNEYRTQSSFANFLSRFKNAANKYPQTNATKVTYPNTAAKFPASGQLSAYAFQITNGGAGAYKVEFFSGEFTGSAFTTVDFDADVRVWYDHLDSKIYIPAVSTVADCLFEGDENTNGAAKKIGKDVGCTFFVEVSWPAGVSYGNQEHRLYKFDYFAM